MNNRHSAFIRPAIFTVTLLMAAQTVPATASWATPFAALVSPSFWAATATKIVDGIKSVPTSRWIIAGLCTTTAIATWCWWKAHKENTSLRQRHTNPQQDIITLNAHHQAEIDALNLQHQREIINLNNQLNALRIAQNPQPAAPVAPAQPAIVPARPASAPAVVAQLGQQPAPQQPAPARNIYLDSSNISRVSHM